MLLRNVSQHLEMRDERFRKSVSAHLRPQDGRVAQSFDDMGDTGPIASKVRVKRSNGG